MDSVNNIKSDIIVLRDIANDVRERSVMVLLNELSDKLSGKRFFLVIAGLFKRGLIQACSLIINISNVVCTSIVDVLDLLLYPKRLLATLRN